MRSVAPNPDALAGVPPISLDPRPLSLESTNYPIEGMVLSASLNALQFARWQKWEDHYMAHASREVQENPVYRGEVAKIMHSMERAPYRGALLSLVERFGDSFFEASAGTVMDQHLGHLHTKDMTPESEYRAHADIPALNDRWIEAAQVVTGNHHFLMSMKGMGSPVNALPLYGDIDFWSILHKDRRRIFKGLARRYLEYPDAVQTETAWSSATVQPRALLRDHFTEAYHFLLSTSGAFTAPARSVAVSHVRVKR